MTIQAGSGFSQESDPFQAGYQAAQTAVAPLQGEPPNIVFAFITNTYHYADVVKGITILTGDTPVIATASQGVFNGHTILDTGVVVLALYDEQMQTTLAIEEGLSYQPLHVVEKVTYQLENKIPPYRSGKHTAAFTLADGTSGALVIDDVLQHATTTLGPFCAIVGGCVGQMGQQSQNSAPIFAQNNCKHDALAMALLSTPAPMGVGVRHGWKPLGHRLLITRSDNDTIYQLDNKPALEVYREHLPDHTITPENFPTYALQYPLGFVLIDNELLIRTPIQANSDGSLQCLGTLPGSAVTYIMETRAESLLQSAWVATNRALAAIGNRQVSAAIVIESVARPAILHDQAASEIELIHNMIGNTKPLIGLYSIGEFAADSGAVNYRNNTIVVYLIGQP